MKLRGRYILLCVAFIAAGGGLHQASKALFAAHSFSFTLDSRVSPSMHATITQAAQEASGSLYEIADAICVACPMVKSVSVHRTPKKELVVICAAHDPFVCLADHAVLLANGALVERDSFCADALDALPVIAGVKAGAAPSCAFTQWLLRLDPALLHEYRIVWCDDYELYLCDKKDGQKKIVCSIGNTITHEMREKCQQIMQEKQDAHGTAHKALYTADIRFEKQIILCSHTGGVYRG